MASTLQDMRKEAGYKTAREFAEAIDVPVATYARYEQSPTKIPIKNAWHIADVLGCSIDAVVGREHVDVDSMRGEYKGRARVGDVLIARAKVGVHKDNRYIVSVRTRVGDKEIFVGRFITEIVNAEMP